MAGAGYKLFNTGDVLTAAQVNTYLMEQTVMVFANAAARTTALSGVVSEGMISYLKDTNAVEVYDGSNWVSSDDPNAIQNTIVDAKGDLITATAADTPSRIAVGNNGETLVADSSQSTGLRWNPIAANLANPVINGGMDIWQRGTSKLNGGNSYVVADRWLCAQATVTTFSRQNVNDSTNLPNIQYCLRAQRTSGSTQTDAMNISQSIETVNSIPFAGKPITFSFYARAGANYSATSSLLNAQLITGTGTDQNVYTVGYTGSAILINQNATLTTTWQRFAYTGTVASNVTEIGLTFVAQTTGTAGANDWYEITGIQIDVGTYTASTAPTFRRSGGTLAGELAACQRYYYRNNYSGLYCPQIIWMATSTTNLITTYQHPVVMRSNPTLANGGSAQGYPPILDRAGTFSCIAYYTGSGFTAQYSYRSTGNVDGTSYTEFSAEL